MSDYEITLKSQMTCTYTDYYQAFRTLWSELQKDSSKFPLFQDLVINHSSSNVDQFNVNVYEELRKPSNFTSFVLYRSVLDLIFSQRDLLTEDIVSEVGSFAESNDDLYLYRSVTDNNKVHEK